MNSDGDRKFAFGLAGSMLLAGGLAFWLAGGFSSSAAVTAANVSTPSSAVIKPATHTVKPKPASTHTVKPKPAPTVTKTAPAAPAVQPVIIINNPPAVASSTAPAAPPSAPASQALYDPWTVVSQYFADIETGNYLSAWNMQSPSFQAANGGYDKWVAGYSGTSSQNLTEISESGSTVDVNLQAIRTDGETQYFTGWYTIDQTSGLIITGSFTQTG
jgi:hypothetical protein